MPNDLHDAANAQGVPFWKQDWWWPAFMAVWAIEKAFSGILAKWISRIRSAALDEKAASDRVETLQSLERWKRETDSRLDTIDQKLEQLISRPASLAPSSHRRNQRP